MKWYSGTRMAIVCLLARAGERSIYTDMEQAVGWGAGVCRWVVIGALKWYSGGEGVGIVVVVVADG